jgi:hypothetical protein
MPYSIYNEDNERMRVVGRLEEAKNLIHNKPDWSYKFFRVAKQPIETFTFEEAPF